VGSAAWYFEHATVIDSWSYAWVRAAKVFALSSVAHDWGRSISLAEARASDDVRSAVERAVETDAVHQAAVQQADLAVPGIAPLAAALSEIGVDAASAFVTFTIQNRCPKRVRLG
jgi:hypothetical protein